MVHGVHVVMHVRMRRCTGKNRNREIKLAWGNNRAGRHQMQEQISIRIFPASPKMKPKRATRVRGAGSKSRDERICGTRGAEITEALVLWRNGKCGNDGDCNGAYHIQAWTCGAETSHIMQHEHSTHLCSTWVRR